MAPRQEIEMKLGEMTLEETSPYAPRAVLDPTRLNFLDPVGHVEEVEGQADINRKEGSHSEHLQDVRRHGNQHNETKTQMEDPSLISPPFHYPLISPPLHLPFLGPMPYLPLPPPRHDPSLDLPNPDQPLPGMVYYNWPMFYPNGMPIFPTGQPPLLPLDQAPPLFMVPPYPPPPLAPQIWREARTQEQEARRRQGTIQEQRKEFRRQNRGLCYRCFAPGHKADQCPHADGVWHKYP